VKVATYYNNTDIRIDEAKRPQIKEGELLIKVEASGICGTDVIEWYRRDKTPLVLGHEIAGVIEEVAPGLTQFKKGMRVSASHHVPCGKCTFCLAGHQTTCDTLRTTKFFPGGFSQFLLMPALNVELKGVYPLPKNISFDEGTFTETLACVMRGQRMAQMSEGKSVLIVGAGISGILHLLMARHNGASFIAATDIVPFRLQKAKELGANAVINATDDVADTFRSLNGGKGADLVIIATGAEKAHQQALASVERGGVVLFFAATAEGVKIPVSVNEVFWRNEVTLTSTYAATPQEHLDAIELIAKGEINVKQLITHCFGLESIKEGFRLVASAQDSLKVIIHPHE